ncbi:MAG: tRNA pseudouridine(55) synthase TruB [Chloroflexi bacterium]|nr:tRNA pseudouridine(55) synthase TruB [Chloroflexota bacterium]
MTATSGILNVDKPAGYTSFQVVALVRRGSGVRKVGHAGTLDPAATGVLVVCLGQAARVSEYLMELPKVYRAGITLGTATDTYDGEGKPTFTADFSGISEGQLMAALSSFVGSIEQTPPAFSAVKVRGQPAYRLARRGQQPLLKPRPARIDRIEVLRFQAPLVELQVECGKGTYIRSLAHDLGQRLGCGAHLSGLTRTRVGPFTLDSAVTLAELEEALAEGTWPSLLLPIDCGLIALPAVTLDMEDEKDIRHGCPLSAGQSALAPPSGPVAGQRCRAYGEDGSLVAVITYDSRADVWRPEKVFAPSEKAISS